MTNISLIVYDISKDLPPFDVDILLYTNKGTLSGKLLRIDKTGNVFEVYHSNQSYYTHNLIVINWSNLPEIK